jgi:Ni/Fe-hydrogenase subunit HybB-like protein
MASSTVTASGPALLDRPGDPRSLEELVFRPLVRVGPGYWALVAGLSALVAFGVYAYTVQLSRGLAVTGLGDRVVWGLYIANFVFFIGISHAGTLISAILRVSHAGWRAPVTRMAEFITVVALMVGALLPIIDLGRPDRVLNTLLFGRWQSPIIWDVLAIGTYLVGSLIYLYLPLIPDLALVRDRLSTSLSRSRRWLYRTLAIGWSGSAEQRRHLDAGIALMAVLIIPIAVSVHTVVSWIFAMTLRVGWDSALFGAFFVVGAIFSGIAVLIVVMAILRRVLRLEDYLTPKHFLYLGYMLAAVGLVMVYLNLLEMVTIGYKLHGSEAVWLSEQFTGAMAPMYWAYAASLVVPGLVVLHRGMRRVGPIVAAALLVMVAMWVERWVIVVGSLRVGQAPYSDFAQYGPTWVEVAITVGLFALFALLITLAVRFLPVVSVWEVREHEEAARP